MSFSRAGVVAQRSTVAVLAKCCAQPFLCQSRLRASDHRFLFALSDPSSGPLPPRSLLWQSRQFSTDGVREGFPAKPEPVGLKPSKGQKRRGLKIKEEVPPKQGTSRAPKEAPPQQRESKDSAPKMSEGLAGVYAAETAIATVGVKGTGLTYRGYRIEDLATKCRTFEEVAFLLLLGHLPAENELNRFSRRLIDGREVRADAKKMLEMLPATTDPMDVLRTCCSYIGCTDPEAMPEGDRSESGGGRSSDSGRPTDGKAVQAKPSMLQFSEDGQLRAAMKLLAILPGMLFYWWHFHFSKKRISEDSLAPTFAQHFFELLFAPQTAKQINRYAIEALTTSLILYAEHELNASTFAARVTAGTLSDYFSCITTAVGTLKGPLHGGASEAAMALLDSIKSEDEVDQKLHAMTSQKQLIMGFGHRIYKTGDPRSDIIKEWARKLCEEVPNPLNPLPAADPAEWQPRTFGDPTENDQSEQAQEQVAKNRSLFRKAEAIENWMLRERRIYPNLDFYSAVVYRMVGIPTELFTPIFALARLTGWSAHVFEQRRHNKLIRPMGFYVGPEEREFVEMQDRVASMDVLRGRL